MESLLEENKLIQSRLKKEECSTIMLTLGTRINYKDAELVKQYLNWKKYEF